MSLIFNLSKRFLFLDCLYACGVVCGYVHISFVNVFFCLTVVGVSFEENILIEILGVCVCFMKNEK